MAVREKNWNVCKACYDDASSIENGSLRAAWIISMKPPLDEDPKRDKAIWRHVRPFLCYYRLAENKKRFDNKAQKKSILSTLWNGRQEFPEAVRQPILEALADYELDSKTLLWLALRPGTLPKERLRQVAVELAEQAVQFTDIGSSYPMVYHVLEALRRYMTEGTNQTLQIPREQVYIVQQALLEEVYVKPQMHTATQTLSAACFRSSWDAAVLALSRTYTTLEQVGVEEESILSTLTDSVRSVVQTALMDYVLPNIEPWTELEEV